MTEPRETHAPAREDFETEDLETEDFETDDFESEDFETAPAETLPDALRVIEALLFASAEPVAPDARARR